MPSIAHFRSFGCKVYSPLDKGKRGGKLGEVRRAGVLIGYFEESPSYRVWDPAKGKVLNLGGADFDEDVEPGWWKGMGEVEAGIRDDGIEVEFPDLEVPEVREVPGTPGPPAPPPPLAADDILRPVS